MAKKKTTRERSTTREDDPDFETALSEVEQIVSELESGELGLTQSLEQYETGIKRLKQCHKLLDAAAQRVTFLSGFDADGNPITQAMPEASDDGETERPRRARRRKPRQAPAEEDDRVDDGPGLF